MRFEDVVKSRRSVRSFLDKKVPQKTLNQILKLANLSPSAGNLQARLAVVVEKKELIEAIAKMKQTWIAQAPVVLIICALPEASSYYKERGRNLYAIQDATILASYVQLTATSLGLGSCWVGSFDEDKLRQLADIPKDALPIVLMPLGYPAEKGEFKGRKAIHEIALFVK